MHRRDMRVRPDWQEKVEKLGLVYHTTNGKPYWNESACYEFSAREVDEIEAATNTLHGMCLQAAEHVIYNNRYGEIGIPPQTIDAIRWAWETEPPSLYGRFDLAYDGYGPPKMLEYNADTPTALLEAAVVQWYWKEEVEPGANQFNSLWEALVAKWSELKSGGYLAGNPVYFGHARSTEDLMTVSLLRDTAQEAGVATEGIHMNDIGWNSERNSFVDLQERQIRTIFKLYPWEWMLGEQFSVQALRTYPHVQWIEPIWKMLLSSKGILAILWEMFPNHPNLLPAYLGRSRDLTRYVKKPLFSREGANIMLKDGSSLVRSDGPYDDPQSVFQDLGPVPDMNGNRPVIGSWVIDGAAHGMGIRESDGPITDNLSRFVPHVFR